MGILVGFEILTGKRVEIPDEGHAAFFGQTQLSGKTTLIEAITYRAPENLKAVAFITKRGEGSFLTARMIPPYFSEPSNDPEQPLWRWVSAILEASQQRKLRFEESWIIRACEEPRYAKSLADVHKNITDLLNGERQPAVAPKPGAMAGRRKSAEARSAKRGWLRKPVTGIHQGVYTSLKAYFDIVMPQLQRMPYTKTLKLAPGLSVMDLREYSMEAQGMVIRSVMEYVYQHERNTRVIVPEAQDFVPQGKNSPVKMACETMVRKGAADRNFMWLDSQDMAAVDKVMLRAVSILGVGVQGEAHEMGRAIAHLFGAATRLTPRDIGSLKVGQFFLRLAGGDVTKVYVQPAWMDSEIHAKAIAMGHEPVSSAKQILRKFKEEKEVKEIKEVKERPAPQMQQILEQTPPSKNPIVSEFGDTVPQPGDGWIYPEDGRLKETLVGDDGIVRHFDHDTGDPWEQVAHGSESRVTGHESRITEEEAMWKEKYETLKHDFEQLREAHDAMAIRLQNLLQSQAGLPAIAPDLGATVGKNSPAKAGPKPAGDNGAAAQARRGAAALDTGAMEELYGYIKSRARNDPGILQLLAEKPELRVTIQRPVIEYDDSTITGRIARLIADKFFDQPKNGPTVQKELKRRGCDQPTTNLYKPLNKLTEQGFLTIESDGYKAVAGMKVNLVEERDPRPVSRGA